MQLSTHDETRGIAVSAREQRAVAELLCPRRVPAARCDSSIHQSLSLLGGVFVLCVFLAVRP